jgi:capsular polysaccharide biosynthesis protein
MAIPDQYLAHLTDVLCLPRQVLIKNGHVLPDSFRRRMSIHPHVQLNRAASGTFSPKMDAEPQTTIEEPCFYLDGEHVDHFGHFTLEVLSRLWPFQVIDFSQFVFLTSATPIEYHAQFLRPFGIERSQIRYFQTPVLCRKLVVAAQGYGLESFVSDAALAVWGRIGDFYDDGTLQDKLYVSRSNWKKQRNLVNEAEIEAFVQSAGYQIIYPETMSVPDQIQAFRNARVIVGPSGSSLYNCVYCKVTGQRAILASSEFVTLNDSLVNGNARSRITYLTGSSMYKDTPPMLSDWRIDSAIVRDFVASL